MDGFIINIGFLLYMAIVPLFGLFGFLWLPKRKLRYKIYAIFITVILALSLFGINFTPQIFNVFIWMLFLYMLSEFVWVSLKSKFLLFKITIPFLGILIFLTISSLYFMAGIAGGRIFPTVEYLSKQYFGIYRYQIVRTDHFSTGCGWSNYEMYFGIRGVPLSFGLYDNYGGRGIRKEINSIVWEKQDKKVLAKLYIDKELAGTIRN